MAAARPSLATTPIPGWSSSGWTARDDARGFFKENWQREKMLAIGLPDFGPVQNNVSFNADRGVTRGIHTEPWDKFVSLATGRIFGAWVDMREGESFGATFSPGDGHLGGGLRARGASATPTRRSRTRPPTPTSSTSTGVPGVAYPALHLDDPTVAIPWPIPLDEAISPTRTGTTRASADVTPMAPKKTLVLGAGGQLGRALVAAFPGAEGVTRATLDVTDAEAVAAWPWHEYAVVLNAAAYTAVDAAETAEGRRAAWAANATAPGHPGPAGAASTASPSCTTPRSTSSTAPSRSTSRTSRCPRSGSTPRPRPPATSRSALAPRHYLLRTSWVIGEGKNFVRTMQSLAGNGVSPSVVADQVGRLTFTDELVRATRHLLDSGAAAGTYHVSNGGPAMSWAEVAQAVFERSGRSADDVTPINTEEYAAGVLEKGNPSRRGRCARRCRWTRSGPPASSPRTRWSRSSATWLDAAGGRGASSGLGAAVVVLEPADVVLAGVGAALHLDDHQLLVVRVGDPVRRARGRRRPSGPASATTVSPSTTQVAVPAMTTQCSERCSWVW